MQDETPLERRSAAASAVMRIKSPINDISVWIQGYWPPGESLQALLSPIPLAWTMGKKAVLPGRMSRALLFWSLEVNFHHPGPVAVTARARFKRFSHRDRQTTGKSGIRSGNTDKGERAVVMAFYDPYTAMIGSGHLMGGMLGAYPGMAVSPLAESILRAADTRSLT